VPVHDVPLREVGVDVDQALVAQSAHRGRMVERTETTMKPLPLKIGGAWVRCSLAMLLVCSGLIGLMGSRSAWAQGIIMDTSQVEQALARGALLWDARDERDYLAGHIPGAVNFGQAGDLFRDANREDPPSPEVASRLFGAAGLDILQREIIVYTRKGDALAYYAARMVEFYGGRHARVYHGGLDDWQSAGKPVSRTPTRLPPVSLTLNAEMRGAVDNRQLLQRLGSGSVQIIDTRTAQEYSGEDIRAVRGGHIPGAVLIPYEQNWQDPGTASKLASRQVNTRDGMVLKPVQELLKLYSGLDPNKETIVYCQSAVRASETAAVLRDLGFKDVKVHEPSWLGYAGQLSAPAAKETFVNVGALNGRIQSLMGRVQQLEAEVQRLRAVPAR
jgi:thiosulfate/3-mercaptopyruvate sulfurtransferase